MPLKITHKWPKLYGFDVHGDGPCYVISVEKGSIAHEAGLLPGDQILEMDEQAVHNMSGEALRTLAKHSRSQPPTLGVVSRLALIEYSSHKSEGSGFSVFEGRPVMVKDVSKHSAAKNAGLAPGDIILEVNGKAMITSNDVRPFMSPSTRKITMSIIPSGREIYTSASRLGHRNLNNNISRVKKARDLHEMMNDILGDDYEKKMAVIGVLKQYAEDRDVEILGRALAAILKTPQQRRVIKQIRQFIPPTQRPKLDDVLRRYQVLPEKHSPKREIHSSPKPGASHKIGQRKTLQVLREGGNFGFVIKGSNPAFIESIDNEGPAERAGLLTGDFIMKLNGIDVRKCSHSHLVHLLQDSGTSPIVEILRCPNGRGPPGMTVTSSASSNSSHDSSDWVPTNDKNMSDKDGKTFKERIDYLLTSREKSRLKKALVEYDATKNIIDFHNNLCQIFDSPSKKTLWMFIIAKLPPPHQEYCLNKVSLPKRILLGEYYIFVPTDSSTDSGWPSSHPTSPRTDNHHQMSFQQHVDYLLTARERSQLKKALQLYSGNRNVENLIEDLVVILDTPSKQTLWTPILPLLSSTHQEIVKRKLHLKIEDKKGLYPTESYIGTWDESGKTYAHPHQLANDEFRLVGEAAAALRSGVDNVPLLSSEDEDLYSLPHKQKRKLVKTPSQTKRMPMDMESAQASTISSTFLDPALLKELEETRKAVHEAKEVFQSSQSSRAIQHEEDDGTKYVTIIPVGYEEFEGKPFHSKQVDSPEFRRMRMHRIHKQQAQENGLHVPHEMNHNKYSSNNEIEMDHTMNISQLSGQSEESFNAKAMVALKQLDAAVWSEGSDIDKPSAKSTGFIFNPLKSAAPPPPPVPPPLPLSPTTAVNTAQMNVKRINWEKLEQEKVGNTIWEQLGHSDIEDVVRYLELEQHFSTKTPKTKILERKNEVQILNPKKAYNISILMGHLKLNIDEMKHALYKMDELVLTPELIKQLVAYAPDATELEHYDTFVGEKDDLSKPDVFAFEMSRVPGYEQRLKALLFKANFKEKVDEMKQNLHHIRRASQELRYSTRLAKILELILAMGNYMNQGNQRVGQAAGFHISFLSQLDVTKTTDNKSTFLHVLADAVNNRFPDVLLVMEDLPTVGEASKVSNVILNQELQELRKVLQDISSTLDKFGEQKASVGVGDRFQDIMGHFISQASDEIQGLFRLQATTMEEFNSLVQFLGEDNKKSSTSEIFGTFSEFLAKFEKAHRENLLFRKH
ncbi:hypothetical protein ScPMuIL_003569 [Solemya velum]